MDPIGEFLRAVVKPGQCVFDVGANIGHYTRILRDLVGAQGSLYAFEPNPINRKKLFANFASKNVHLFEYALSNKEGEVDFHIDCRPGMDGLASSLVRLDNFPDIQTIKVKTTTIDTLCQKLNLTPALLKIDVEGHEHEVIQGAEQLIKTSRPFIVFEFWETWWDKVRLIFEFLQPYYHLIRVQDGADVSRWYYDNKSAGQVDIGCVPKER